MAAPRVSFGEKDLENGQEGAGAADRYVLALSPAFRCSAMEQSSTMSRTSEQRFCVLWTADFPTPLRCRAAGRSLAGAAGEPSLTASPPRVPAQAGRAFRTRATAGS